MLFSVLIYCKNRANRAIRPKKPQNSLPEAQKKGPAGYIPRAGKEGEKDVVFRERIYARIVPIPATIPGWGKVSRKCH